MLFIWEMSNKFGELVTLHIFFQHQLMGVEQKFLVKNSVKTI